jgi:hypothetical protein
MLVKTVRTATLLNHKALHIWTSKESQLNTLSMTSPFVSYAAILAEWFPWMLLVYCIDLERMTLLLPWILFMGARAIVAGAKVLAHLSLKMAPANHLLIEWLSKVFSEETRVEWYARSNQFLLAVAAASIPASPTMTFSAMLVSLFYVSRQLIESLKQRVSLDETEWPKLILVVAYANWLALSYSLVRWEQPVFVLFRASVLLAAWCLMIRQLVRSMTRIMDSDHLTPALNDLRANASSRLFFCSTLFVSQQTTLLWAMPLLTLKSRLAFLVVYLLITLAICLAAA